MTPATSPSSSSSPAARFPARPLEAPAVAAALAWRKKHPLDPAGPIVDELLLVIADCGALLEDAGKIRR